MMNCWRASSVVTALVLCGCGAVQNEDPAAQSVSGLGQVAVTAPASGTTVTPTAPAPEVGKVEPPPSAPVTTPMTTPAVTLEPAPDSTDQPPASTTSDAVADRGAVTPAAWAFEGVSVGLDSMASLLPDPMSPGEVTDRDRQNGLFELKSWQVAGSPTGATLAIQRNDTGRSTIDPKGYDETRLTDSLMWGLNTAQSPPGGPPLVFAWAIIDGLVVHISGPAKTVDEMISNITATKTGPTP